MSSVDQPFVGFQKISKDFGLIVTNKELINSLCIFQKGIEVFFNPNVNPKAQAKFKEWYDDLKTIKGFVVRYKTMSVKLAEVTTRVDNARLELQQVEDQRKLLQKNRKEEEATFAASYSRLQVELAQASDSLSAPSLVPIITILNPLMTQKARLSVFIGQYAAPIAMSCATYFQREPLSESCGQLLLGEMNQTFQCVGSLGNTVISWPVGASVVVSIACWILNNSAQNILRHQKEIERINQALKIECENHQKQSTNIQDKEEILSREAEKSCTVIERSEEVRKQVLGQQQELRGHVATIVQKQLEDTMKIQCKLLEDIFEAEDTTNLFIRSIGAAAVETIGNTFVSSITTAVINVPNKLLQQASDTSAISN